MEVDGRLNFLSVLLQRLQADHQLTHMVISHSLGVLQHISDRIAVPYLGEVVELAAAECLRSAPASLHASLVCPHAGA